MKNNEKYYDTPIGRLPSVTTYLSLLNKPALINWAVKMALTYVQKHLNDILTGKLTLTDELAGQILATAREENKRISEKAMDIGSRTHQLINQYYQRLLNGEQKTDIEREILFALDTSDKDCIKPFGAFLKWNEENQVEPLETEQVVWSKKGYAGTLDLACRINTKLYIVDFKTSAGFWKEYSLQIAAYAKAWAERNDIHKKIGLGILRLDKETGMPEFRDYTFEYKRNIQTFLALIKVWRGLKEVKKDGGN